MDVGLPAFAQHGVERAAGEFEPAAVDPITMFVGTRTPDQHGRAVGHGAEAVLAFAQDRLGPFAVGDVLDQRVEASYFAVCTALRNVVHLHKPRALRVIELPLVEDRLAGERPLHVGPNRVVHLAVDHVAEPLSQARGD